MSFCPATWRRTLSGVLQLLCLDLTTPRCNSSADPGPPRRAHFRVRSLHLPMKPPKLDGARNGERWSSGLRRWRNWRESSGVRHRQHRLHRCGRGARVGVVHSQTLYLTRLTMILSHWYNLRLSVVNEHYSRRKRRIRLDTDDFFDNTGGGVRGQGRTSTARYLQYKQSAGRGTSERHPFESDSVESPRSNWKRHHRCSVRTAATLNAELTPIFRFGSTGSACTQSLANVEQRCEGTRAMCEPGMMSRWWWKKQVLSKPNNKKTVFLAKIRRKSRGTLVTPGAGVAHLERFSFQAPRFAHADDPLRGLQVMDLWDVLHMSDGKLVGALDEDNGTGAHPAEWRGGTLRLLEPKCHGRAERCRITVTRNRLESQSRLRDRTADSECALRYVGGG
ncbi:hypothetical protein B0H11DRAFT_1941017 [Mycena galericulata]|nr:hypothetical protein B0H11DRAFT_1941017 [Mycena galericulata]